MCSVYAVHNQLAIKLLLNFVSILNVSVILNVNDNL